jgi:hypothetical protein
MAAPASRQLHRDIWVAILPFLEGRDQLLRVRPLCRTAEAGFRYSAGTNQFEMTISPDKINRLAAVLGRLPHLTGVTVDYGDGDRAYSDHCFPLPSIRKLTIVGWGAPTPIPSILLMGMEKVESFVLTAAFPGNPHYFSSIVGLAVPVGSAPLTHLRHLELTYSTNPDAVLELLKSSQAFVSINVFLAAKNPNLCLTEIAKQSQLVTLRLLDEICYDEGLFDYSILLRGELSRNPHLRIFKPSSHMTCDQLIAFLRQHPQLIDLDLSGLKFGIVDDRVVDVIATLTNLRSLRFPHCCVGVTDRGLEVLVRACTQLRELSLPGESNITIQGLRGLAGIGPQLQLLRIPAFQFDDAGIEMLGTFTQLRALSLAASGYSMLKLQETLGKLIELEKLNLSCSLPFDHSFMQILGEKCRKLTSLNLYSNIAVFTTQEAIDLVGQLPNLAHVNYAPEGETFQNYLFQNYLMRNKPHINNRIWS